MAGALDSLDIVLRLSTIRSAQTDDSSRLASIHKGRVVERLRLWRQRDHADFGVVKTVINPCYRGVPIEFTSKRRGDAVPALIRGVFGRVELDSLFLL